MESQPAALLFDLDGTLVDTIDLIMESMEFAFKDFQGPKPTRDKWLLGLGITLRTQLADYARSPEEIDWLIARYRIYQGEHHDRGTVPYAGVREVLDELYAAGHPMAIVTSKYYAGAHKALVHVGFTKYFSSVVGGDSVVNPKPNPEPVFKALSELDASAGHAYFVGDSPHDINAGNAAGVKTVAATWGPFSKAQIAAARPTHWLTRFSELPGLVGRLKGEVGR
jgi:pyrophosphatase PpaX